MKVLLLNVYGTIAYKQHKSSIFPSLNLAYVHESLKNNGITDIGYYELFSLDNQFRQMLIKEQYDHILINNQRYYTYFAFMYPLIIKTAVFIKKILFNTIITVADSQLQVFPDLYSKIFEIDHFIISEVENTFPFIISQYRNYRPVDKTVDIPYIDELDKLPFPDKNILIQSAYTGTSSRKYYNTLKAQMITSKGCPYDCTYCSSPLIYKKKTRYRSIDNIYTELKALHEIGVKHIVIWDEIFTYNKKLLFQFMRAISEFKITWSCNTRIDSVDGDLLAIMAASGCRSILYGLERLSSHEIKNIAPSKKMDVEQYRNLFINMEQLGIESVASIMVGLENDTKELLSHEAAIIRYLNPSFCYIRTAIPLPGTVLYNDMVHRGRIPPVSEWICKEYMYSQPYGFPVICQQLDRESLNEEIEIMNKSLDL